MDTIEGQKEEQAVAAEAQAGGGDGTQPAEAERPPAAPESVAPANGGDGGDAAQAAEAATAVAEVVETESRVAEEATGEVTENGRGAPPVQ
jgi:hypothetical protein